MRAEDQKLDQSIANNWSVKLVEASGETVWSSDVSLLNGDLTRIVQDNTKDKTPGNNVSRAGARSTLCQSIFTPTTRRRRGDRPAEPSHSAGPGRRGSSWSR